MSEPEDPRALREIAASLLEIANLSQDRVARDECIRFAIRYHERALEVEALNKAAAEAEKSAG